MISKKIQDAMNNQINAELASAYLYLSMAAYFEAHSLDGFANWMKVQAQEETIHAMKFYAHLGERGGRVLLAPIVGPQTDWESPLAVFEATLQHEQKVTALINDLATLADAEKDRASFSLLQWFVDEQVEEEKSADDVIQQLKLMKDAPGGIFMLDRELAQRTFVVPPEMAAGLGLGAAQ